MAKSIYLDLGNQNEKTVFVEIKNTSDKDIDLTFELKHMVRDSGYKVVDYAKQAAYLYKANIFYVRRETDPAVIRTAVTKG